jgi:hypothetical protein
MSLRTDPGAYFARKLKQTGFTEDDLSHQVVVHRGPKGQPGEVLQAPSRSLYKPRMTLDRAREDFRVFIGREGSSFAAVCLGTLERRGTPEEAMRKARRRHAKRGRSVLTMHPERVAGEEAQRYRIVLNLGELNEWLFAHEGWLWVAGVLNFGFDEQLSVRRARAVFDTWQWL